MDEDEEEVDEMQLIRKKLFALSGNILELSSKDYILFIMDMIGLDNFFDDK